MLLDFLLNILFLDKFTQSVEAFEHEQSLKNYESRALTAQAFSNSLPTAENRTEPLFLPPVKTNLLSMGVDITAESALLLDRDSKAVLWGKDGRKQTPIASITKLATVLVFLDENPELSGTATLALQDYIPFGRQVIRTGEPYHVKDLFYAVLVGSDNNAAALLAKSTGLDREEFAKRMNDKAKRTRHARH